MGGSASAARIVIGVGNRYRSDDGIGPRVADLLRDANLSNCRVVEASGEGTELMAMWEDASHVILIDAVRAGDAPGTVIRIDASRDRVPSDLFHYSTHAFSVAEAIEMARALGTLPPSVIVFGVVGESFKSGETLSPAVDAAINDVARRVSHELAS